MDRKVRKGEVKGTYGDLYYKEAVTVEELILTFGTRMRRALTGGGVSVSKRIHAVLSMLRCDWGVLVGHLRAT